jgi:outer membrane protein assembly factor BamE (lipoprotein component of BamABCDE complex)
MTRRGIISFNCRAINWIQRTCSLILITVLLSACAQNPAYLYEAGERPIPPDIEQQIIPHTSTQDNVLTLLGEPVARLKTKTKEGHIHIWTYSYMDLQSPTPGKGESLTITFDDKSFVVQSVTRGPL